MIVGLAARVKVPNSSNSDGGEDSLETIARKKYGKHCQFIRCSSSGVSPSQLSQYIDAVQEEEEQFMQACLMETGRQKCGKCSQVFWSTISYRRHWHSHRRKLNLDKDSATKLRGVLRAFWDTLSLAEIVKMMSFDDVSLEGVSGPSIIKAFQDHRENFCRSIMPLSYVKSGCDILDVIQGRGALGSRRFFEVLDCASENTFLCSSMTDSLQKFVFNGDAGKIALEMRNQIACISILVEQKLVKAYNACKDAEALKHQKLLEEEEAAAQKRQAAILKKKSQKKLRQKERKAKELTNGKIQDSPNESIPSPSSSIPANDHDSTKEMLEIPFDATPSSPKPSHPPKGQEITDTGHEYKHTDFGTPSSIHADDHDTVRKVLEIPFDATPSPEPSQLLNVEGITVKGHENKYPDLGAIPNSIQAGDHDSTQGRLEIPFVVAPFPDPSQPLTVEVITDNSHENKYPDFGATPSSIPAGDHDSIRAMLEVPFVVAPSPDPSQPLTVEVITDKSHENKYPDFGATPSSIPAGDHDSIRAMLEVPFVAAPCKLLNVEGIAVKSHETKYPDFGATPSSIHAGDDDSTQAVLDVPFVASPSPEPSKLLNEGIADKSRENRYQDFGATPSSIHAGNYDSAREMLELPVVPAPCPEPSQQVNVERDTNKDQENRHPNFGARRKRCQDLGVFQNFERRTLNQVGRRQVTNSHRQDLGVFQNFERRTLNQVSRRQVTNSHRQATQSPKIPAVSHYSHNHLAPRPAASQKHAPSRNSHTSATSTEVWKPKRKLKSRRGSFKTSLVVDEPKPPSPEKQLVIGSILVPVGNSVFQVHEKQLLIGSMLVPFGNSVIQGRDVGFCSNGEQLPIQNNRGSSKVCDVPCNVTHPTCVVESTYGCEDESDSCLEARHQGGLKFSRHVAEAFLSQRWKEALMGDYVELNLPPDEPPRHSEAQDVNNNADLSTEEDECRVLRNTENLLPVSTATDSSAAMKPTPPGKHLKARKMK